MSALQDLQQLGQSVWYDNLSRELLDSGQLARYRDDYAVSGVTSNPTIFEKAIAGSHDYDDVVEDGVERGVTDPEELFWHLAIRDVRDAADTLRPVHDRSGGTDGFVSLELPPRLSRDAAGSIELAQELAARVDRPNLLIKVPGTPEGVRAIEELTFRGVNVNVTLLFSIPQWRAVAEAYLAGLERRLAEGEPLDVRSVASFFVSRIDDKANDRLPEHLHNRLAVANSRMAFQAHREFLGRDRWQRVADAGATPQRMLWASTGTKDPSLPETYYVTELAVAGTVNTMPEKTLVAAQATARLDRVWQGDDPLDAPQVIEEAAAAGVDLTDLGEELQVEGDRKFADSFDNLLECIAQNVANARSASAPVVRRVGPVADAVEATLDDLTSRDANARLWRGDHTLWQEDPAECADRLGWLTAPESMRGELDRLREFTASARADGLTHVLVLGMGGSSLFPLVVGEVFGPAGDGLELHVLDSVDPDAIARTQAALPADTTLVVASSKSGTTAETRSLLAHFEQQWGDPSRFAVVTDPGSALGRHARDRGFREVFEADPDVGGRYSALTHFGLVPAALAGADVAALLDRAERLATACRTCVRDADNAGLRLGAVMAGAAGTGRDKLTLVVDDRWASFGLWIEQLVAESTGKHGVGIVPVVGERLAAPDVYGDDRLFVGIGVADDVLAPLAEAGHPVVGLPLDDPADLGREVMRWELATAFAGAALGINPFDQPDVEAAKKAAKAALAAGVSPVAAEDVEPLLDRVGPGDYVTIQAYVDPDADVVARLDEVRHRIRDRYRVATALGVGPRYLHSTGQLHKGGPNTGVFLQVVADHDTDPPIPGEEHGFATLERAQAAGDLEALRARDRRAARVRIDDLLGVGR